MLAGILFLTLIVVVAVLITVDVVRTPTEAPAGSADRHGHDTERAISAARSGTGVRAFSRGTRRAGATRSARGRGRAVRDRSRRGGLLRADRSGGARLRPDAPGNVAVGSQRSRARASKFNAMSVNLSRRSQSLVERQLRLIESLEHGEQDAQRLASLSRLNRIAMRMHRNSQNLLVVAGQEPVPGLEPAGDAGPSGRGRAGRGRGLRTRLIRGTARHRGARACRPRRGAPAGRVDRQRDVVLGGRNAGPYHGPHSDHRWRFGRHHRPGHRNARERDGLREPAAG